MQPQMIDERDSYDLAAQLRRLVSHHVPDWPADADAAQMNEAMIQVFARFGEILVDRVNRAPEKNFLAFLDLLGFTNLPPRAATVPLTFYLAPGAEIAVIPKHTQVAAQQLPGEKDPVIFETDQELVAVANRLSALFVKDGGRGFYSNLSDRLPQAPPAAGAMVAVPEPARPAPAFRGDTAIPHEFYLALPLSAPAPMIDRVALKFGLQAHGSAAEERPSVAWTMYVQPPPKSPTAPVQSAAALASSAAPLPPDMLSAWVASESKSDTTAALTRSGEVAFVDVPATRPQPCWLRCRLLTPVARDGANDQGDGTEVLHAANLPVIQSLTVSLEADRGGIPLEAALFNGAPLDVSKDFYPFGERPKFGDTFYLGSKEMFASVDATVVLEVQITNAADAQGETPVPKVTPHAVTLAWEFWDGRHWSELGMSQEPADARRVDAGAAAANGSFRDTTSAFTSNGEVTIKFPAAPAPVAVGGQVSFWVRVRLVGGNYGHDASRHHDLLGGEAPAGFAPPMIRSIQGSYKYRREFTPQSLVRYNDFSWDEIQTNDLGGTSGKTVQPFLAVVEEEAAPGLYFGFEPGGPNARAANRSSSAESARHSSIPLSLYVDAEESANGISGAKPSGAMDQLAWEYWTGQRWTGLTVRDDTDGLRQPGLVRFVAPTDMVAASRLGCTRYWLRAVPSKPRSASLIRGALLNTVMATGSVTYLNEDLGVSNGTPEQSYSLLHKPVLNGQCLEVLEPHLPSHAGIATVEAEEGSGSFQLAPGADAGTRVWVRWHQVHDFSASGPRDRHYLLDRLAGVVLFGDGVHGQIPRRGATVRAAAYRSGGGAVGNRPAGNITQLKTAVPSVTGAWNWQAAESGGDAEDNACILERGPRAIRNGGRAVTVQDYEDLALLASPKVARARCVPLRDLVADPDGKQHKPGVISVIVVPREDSARPVPSLQLLECVLDYLARFSSPSVQVNAVAPAYIRIDVTAEIVVDDPDSTYQVDAAVRAGLAAYLHPLSGGTDGSGWHFGAKPHKSDLYALLAGIPKVRYVRSVEPFEQADRGGIEGTNRFLITPGDVSLTVSLCDEATVAGGATCR